MHPLPEAEFEALVGDALDTLPDEFFELMDNVVVLIEDEPPEDQPGDLLGLYEGIPHTERGEYGYMDLPDRITLYRLPLCRFAENRDELVDEICITVIHEVAHHFGIDDDRLHELGWA